VGGHAYGIALERLIPASAAARPIAFGETVADQFNILHARKMGADRPLEFKLELVPLTASRYGLPLNVGTSEGWRAIAITRR